jgi:2-haloacid dehalogenase
MTGRSIHGIVFDAYGTLLDVHSVGTLAEQWFPGAGAALAAMWRDKQVAYTWLRTLSDRYVDFSSVTEDALRYSCARLKLELSEERCQRLLGEYRHLTAYPDVVHTIEKLRARGYTLAILSNGTPQMLDSAVAAAGLSEHFTYILSADRVRKFKTAPQVYELGAAAFNCPARELAFVSSNCWDACCATSFGYRTFWVNRAGDPVERLADAPSGEGRSLYDLVGFLDAGRFDRPDSRSR